ncbi:hypothetical protein [Streptomyces sp. MN6]
MRTALPITTSTALAVLDLYVEVYAARHGLTPPTGHKAFRLGLGPVLMLPEAFDVPDAHSSKIYRCDTLGNGHPAIAFSGDEETSYCDCLSIGKCWTRDVRDRLPERGLKVTLEPENFATVGLYLT